MKIVYDIQNSAAVQKFLAREDLVLGIDVDNNAGVVGLALRDGNAILGTMSVDLHPQEAFEDMLRRVILDDPKSVANKESVRIVEKSVRDGGGLQEVTDEYLYAMLVKCHGNKERACKAGRVSRATLYRAMKRWSQEKHVQLAAYTASGKWPDSEEVRNG